MLTKKPPVDTGATIQEKTAAAPKTATPTSIQSSNNNKSSQITVKFNCGYGNNLFIRGEGGGLTWDNGIQLKNLDADTWVWAFDRPFTSCTFKILLNDEVFEIGDNHKINQGETTTFTPQFP